MAGERPPGERPEVEVLLETIDRNRDRDWESYRASFEFTLIGESRVRLARPDEAREVDHVVRLTGGRAASCDCFSARRDAGGMSCRHMRAVDAHPRL